MVGLSPLPKPPRPLRDQLQQLYNVVCGARCVICVQSGIDEIHVEQEIVREHDRRYDGVLDAPAERKFHHRLCVRHIWDEHTRRVEKVHTTTNTPLAFALGHIVFTGYDLDTAANLPSHARLRTCARNFALA